MARAEGGERWEGWAMKVTFREETNSEIMYRSRYDISEWMVDRIRLSFGRRAGCGLFLKHFHPDDASTSLSTNAIVYEKERNAPVYWETQPKYSCSSRRKYGSIRVIDRRKVLSLQLDASKPHSILTNRSICMCASERVTIEQLRIKVCAFECRMWVQRY